LLLCAAQRAEADAARLKARQDRLATTPGPGMYDIRSTMTVAKGSVR